MCLRLENMERKRKISKPEVKRIIMRSLLRYVERNGHSALKGSNFAEKRQAGAYEDDGGQKKRQNIFRQNQRMIWKNMK